MDRMLIDYLPGVLKDFREIVAITKVEQTKIDEAWDAVSSAMNNQFVITSTDYGVSRWEKILKIKPKGTDSLEDRKFRVLGVLRTQLPYTFGGLNDMLKSLCGESGYSVKLQNETYTLTVRVELTRKNNFDDVSRVLKQVCPANLAVILLLMYNQHRTLEKFTHRQLSARTYNQIRNEVFN